MVEKHLPEDGKPRIEPHYTVGEIAAEWKLSTDTVRKLFLDEPGVLKIGEGSRLLGGRKYKRRYFVLRIPAAVLRRVEQKLINKRPAEPVSSRVERGSRDLHAS
jgi:hypothetical protein